MDFIVLLIIAFIIIISIIFFAVAKNYKRCPANKIMVISGKLEGNKPYKFFVGGATFVIPIIQSVDFLDLTVMSEQISLKLKAADNTDINFKARINFAISTDPNVIPNAIERLMGISEFEIKEMAVDTVKSGIRKVLIQSDKDSIRDNVKLEHDIFENIMHNLQKNGLCLKI